MRLIVLGDIHGNIIALKDCIANAVESFGGKIDGFIFLGDYCCDFLEGQECIDVIRNLNNRYPVYVITGNRETGMVIPYKKSLDLGREIGWDINSTMGAALLSCQRMSSDNLDYIANLSSESLLTFEGMDPIYLQHKMPLSKEKITELRNVGCRDILTAHTHEFHDNFYDGFHLLNPGSVGLEDSGIPGATYGVLTWRNNHWRMEKKHIDYDYEAAKKLVKANPILMNQCKNWGKVLIASIDTGVNVAALYMFEVKRIAREYANKKGKDQISNGEIHLGIGRYGNINPIKDYLSERIIVGNKIEYLKFATDEFLENNFNAPIEEWMYDMALENVITNIYALKRKNQLEIKVNSERKFM